MDVLLRDPSSGGVAVVFSVLLSFFSHLSVHGYLGMEGRGLVLFLYFGRLELI